MEIKSLIIGGVIPAVFLGLGTVLMKLSLKAGINIPTYLIFVGATVCAVGGALAFKSSGIEISSKSAAYAIAMGLTWAVAVFCMSYGLSTLKLPVSVVAPISNSNALVSVALGLFLLNEGQHFDVLKIASGTLLIVIGASIVSSS